MEPTGFHCRHDRVTHSPFKPLFPYLTILTSIANILNLGSNYSALRTIRLLRPLRTINKVKGIRVIVKSFILSIPPLANVAIFLLFIILLFATFGLHLFSGMNEYRCRLTKEPVFDAALNKTVWNYDPS